MISSSAVAGIVAGVFLGGVFIAGLAILISIKVNRSVEASRQATEKDNQEDEGSYQVVEMARRPSDSESIASTTPSIWTMELAISPAAPAAATEAKTIGKETPSL